MEKINPENREQENLLERYRRTEVRRAYLGEIPVMYQNWGFPENKDQFLHRYSNVSALDLEMIDNSGFSGGWRVDDDQDIISPEMQEMQAQIAADLIAEALNDRKWRDVDWLVLSSLSFKPENIDKIVQKLAKQGIQVGKTQFYGQACNGLIAGVTDACRRSDMKGKRVAVIGLENLSGSSINHEDVKLTWTFGNGASVIAFIPDVEIKHVVGHTVVEKDEKGVIGLPPAYDLPKPAKRVKPFPWYEIKSNALREFATSIYGVAMKMVPSAKAFMRGRETFAYFARRVPPVLDDVLKQYWQKYSQVYGELGPGWSHQASKPVLTGLQNKLQELAKAGGYPAPNFPWMMQDTGVNNVSSATAGVALVELIRQGIIRPGIAFPVMGYGVGSVIEGDVLLVPEKKMALR